MHFALYVQNSSKAKKLDSPKVESTDTSDGQLQSRLFIKDHNSNYSFLIDTGADLSVLPPSINSKPVPSEIKLFAANNTKIDTFGTKLLTLDLGLRRKFPFKFIIAKVNSYFRR